MEKLKQIGIKSKENEEKENEFHKNVPQWYMRRIIRISIVIVIVIISSYLIYPDSTSLITLFLGGLFLGILLMDQWFIKMYINEELVFP